MSRKKVEVRLSVKDRERLDLVADSFDTTRTGAVRLLIRYWFEKNHGQNAGILPIGGTRV